MLSMSTGISSPPLAKETRTIILTTGDNACTLNLTTSGAGTFPVASAVITAAGGTAAHPYKAGDFIRSNVSNTTRAAVFKVATISGNGVATVTVIDGGSFTADPAGAGKATVAVYNLPAACSQITLQMVGGGGGGAGADTTGSSNGGTGATSTFGSWTCIGGTGGTIGAAGTTGDGRSGGIGGTGGASGTGTTIHLPGGAGSLSTPGRLATGDYAGGGQGGNSVFAGGGGSTFNSGAGFAGAANSGGGGGGAGNINSGYPSGAGGGGGEYVHSIIPAPAQTYDIVVGAGGAAGVGGGVNGGAGGTGVIIVEEAYN